MSMYLEFMILNLQVMLNMIFVIGENYITHILNMEVEKNFFSTSMFWRRIEYEYEYITRRYLWIIYLLSAILNKIIQTQIPILNLHVLLIFNFLGSVRCKAYFKTTVPPKLVPSAIAKSKKRQESLGSSLRSTADRPK